MTHEDRHRARAKAWVMGVVEHESCCDCIRCKDVTSLAAEFAAVRAEAMEEAAEACASAAREEALRAARQDAVGDIDGVWAHRAAATALRESADAIRALARKGGGE